MNSQVGSWFTLGILAALLLMAIALLARETPALRRYMRIRRM